MRLIDADALLKSAKQNFNGSYTNNTIYRCFEEIVGKAPTVDPIKHTHLKKYRYPGTHIMDYYVCANCGVTTRGDANFCHKCGAAFDATGPQNEIKED